MSFNRDSSISRARSKVGRVAALAAALSTLALSVAAPTHASDRQTTVQFEDLDMTRERDVKELYTRLQRASKNVCRDTRERGLSQRQFFKECYEEALQRAVDGVNAVQLTKLHASRDNMVAQRGKVPTAS
jgi:UrcA family protein